WIARGHFRRRLLSVLVRRMAADRKLPPRVLDDLIDVLFALTSFPFFFAVDGAGAQQASGVRPYPGACNGCRAAGVWSSICLSALTGRDRTRRPRGRSPSCREGRAQRHPEG